MKLLITVCKLVSVFDWLKFKIFAQILPLCLSLSYFISEQTVNVSLIFTKSHASAYKSCRILVPEQVTL